MANEVQENNSTLGNFVARWRLQHCFLYSFNVRVTKLRALFDPPQAVDLLLDCRIHLGSYDTAPCFLVRFTGSLLGGGRLVKCMTSVLFIKPLLSMIVSGARGCLSFSAMSD